MVLLARQHQDRTQPIAITGMGCHFPGGIDSPQALWDTLLTATHPPTGRIPTDSQGRRRWNTEAPDLAAFAETLEQGSYLDDVDLFDAGYFGLTPDEAAHTDPQQRLLLHTAVQALADANLTGDVLRRGQVGIYVGLSTVEYNFAGLRNGLGKDDLSPSMGVGTAVSAASSRIGLALGVRGPALTLDTACSSALTAVHLATAALRSGECDVALIGAGHLLLSPFTTQVFKSAAAISPTGTGVPFTADADGYVRSEGCGMLVLERHRDAVAAGRSPYAVIRGSAVHQHGQDGRIGVISVRGLRTVIELALDRAGIHPHEVQYVEAQANGSRLGGILEAEVLADAYRRRDPGAPELAVGSAKTGLGYSETASGVTGLMKVALALQHGVIPPQPGGPDPQINWDGLNLRLPAAAHPWPGPGRRIAGVTAVGFTGTAAHVLMQAVPGATDADAPAAPDRPDDAGPPGLLLLSAHSPQALAGTARRLLAHLQDRDDWSHLSVCRTLAEGRDHRKHRHADVVTGRAEVLRVLRTVAHPPALDSGTKPELPELPELSESAEPPAALAALARAFRSGGRVEPADLGGLEEQHRAALVHLPGPALVGTSYWTDVNVWH
jgi:acyl transferase domain-containing protein